RAWKERQTQGVQENGITTQESYADRDHCEGITVFSKSQENQRIGHDHARRLEADERLDDDTDYPPPVAAAVGDKAHETDEIDHRHRNMERVLQARDRQPWEVQCDCNDCRKNEQTEAWNAGNRYRALACEKCSEDPNGQRRKHV